MSRKLDEIISDIEDVNDSLEEVEHGPADAETLDDAHETLERVTDSLENLDEEGDDTD
jgi:exonuclease VII small subunit